MIPESYARQLYIASLGAVVLLSLLLSAPLLTRQRFHQDEALYATWALDIVTGQNVWLHNEKVDKPPLLLYVLAGSFWLAGPSETAARLPALLATAVSLGLTFALGWRLYGRPGVGLLAAGLLAFSPYTLAYAPTAFTDPLLVMWVLAACLAATYQRVLWAGLLLSLAIATKQQGLFFIPLVMLCVRRNAVPDLLRDSAVILLAMLPALAVMAWWDWDRAALSIWQQSAIHYGGLSSEVGSFAERWWGFVRLLYYATGSPVLNAIFLAGLPVLLGLAGWRRAGFAFDGLLIMYLLAFLTGHAVLSFQPWDRYLLGLMPWLALLLARMLWLVCDIAHRYGSRHNVVLQTVFVALTLLLLSWTLPAPINDAVNGRYPLGSNSHGFTGVEHVVTYLRGHHGAGTTLYHNWLGVHWRFYLYGSPYDLQHWTVPTDLAARIQPGDLIAFPGWRSETTARLALAQVGLSLVELTRGYGVDGTPNIILYEIQSVPGG